MADPALKATLLALTLNERDGIAAIMPRIDRSAFHQILVVDGGSTDGTIEWCREHDFEVYVQRRRGIRFAYIEAWPMIEGDLVMTISPDGNCPPDAIPQLLDTMRQGYDLVIASRYLDGATSEDDDALTAFGNWLFTRTINLLHGGRYTDAMGIFRVYKRSLFYELDLHQEDSYRLAERLFRTVIGVEPLMSVRAAKHAKRIAEIAVSEPARIGGERKLQMFRWGAAYWFQVWREVWHWR